VVAVSGAVDAATEAERLGARALVRKPIDLDQLKHILHQVGCLHVPVHGEQRRALD
jgi:DNA-binding NtrC family response regulator